MVYAPNANWTARATAARQSCVYFLRIDGLATHDYSTHDVKSAGTTKKLYLDIPSSGSISVDVIRGSQTVNEVRVVIHDEDDEITELIATEKDSPTLSTLINRKATIFGGYADLAESDYPAIFVGRITGLRMTPGLNAYELRLSDASYLLDQPIMENATEATPSIVQGNVVNVYWSILTNTFSTTHATFPLDSYSGSPTGIGIPSALLNETEIEAQRDFWYAHSKVKVEFDEPEGGRDHLTSEFFRVFQAWPAIGGDGTIGLRFHTPPVPASSAPTLDDDDIVAIRGWRRVFEQHLNRYTYAGDYSLTTGDYETTLYNTETSGDTTNQTNTSEVVEYRAESRWLRSSLSGATLAATLAGRLRLRFRETPVELDLDLTFRKRNLEQGDVVALTTDVLPDLLLGTRGLTSKLMTVMAITPDFANGVIRVKLLDTGYDRYGAIAPSGTPDYGSASALEKASFCFIGDASNEVGSSEKGYKQI